MGCDGVMQGTINQIAAKHGHARPIFVLSRNFENSRDRHKQVLRGSVSALTL